MVSAGSVATREAEEPWAEVATAEEGLAGEGREAEVPWAKVATVEEVKAAMEVDWKVVEVRVVGARAVEVRAQDTSRQ